MGERSVCVARELSKRYEEFRRGSVSEVLAHYDLNPPRGEITLIIGGYSTDDDGVWDEKQVREALLAQLAQGESLNYAAKTVSKLSGWNKRDVYALGMD
jgi:16S rRNA (cytidine1402-2'-O)-methyltransferase